MRFARIVFAWLLFCSVAVAQVGQIPGWPPTQPVTSVGPPTVTFTSSTSFGSHAGAVETYTSFTIGTAAGFTTRRIICTVSTNNLSGPTAISSATIGGISATIHVQTGLGSGAPFSGIFSADVPTGTTATIVVTYNATLSNDQPLACYSVDDALMNSTTPTTGSGTASGVTTVSTSSFNQSTGGFTIAGSAISANSTGYAVTGYTTDAFGGTTNVIMAHLGSIGSTGSVVATATWGASLNSAIVAASWR